MTATPAAPVAVQIRALLADVTGQPSAAELPDGTALLGGGIALSSLTATLLLRRIERRFGVDVASGDLNLDALATLGTLIGYVEARFTNG